MRESTKPTAGSGSALRGRRGRTIRVNVGAGDFLPEARGVGQALTRNGEYLVLSWNVGWERRDQDLPLSSEGSGKVGGASGGWGESGLVGGGQSGEKILEQQGRD